MAHVRGRGLDAGGTGCSGHRRPLAGHVHCGEFHHREQPEERERRPGREDEQGGAGDHALERVAVALNEAGVGERGAGEAEDGDDHELRQHDRDQEFDESARPAAGGGPDHGDEGEREEEDADVNRGVADDELEPEHERADREDDRAEEDAEEGDAGGLVERVLVGIPDRLQQVRRLRGAEAADDTACHVIADRDEQAGGRDGDAGEDERHRQVAERRAEQQPDVLVDHGLDDGEHQHE